MPTSYPSEEPRYCITISIVYDYFPSETSWELISDEDGAIVHEYRETDDIKDFGFDLFCLTGGWYTFKIFDDLGEFAWSYIHCNMTFSSVAMSHEEARVVQVMV